MIQLRYSAELLYRTEQIHRDTYYLSSKHDFFKFLVSSRAHFDCDKHSISKINFFLDQVDFELSFGRSH